MPDDEDFAPAEEGAQDRAKRLPQVTLVRVLVVVGLVLAVGATLALVLANSLDLLRFGLIAALWAALAGAYVTARYRRDATVRSAEIETLHTAYELELEREITAHREREQQIEAEAKERAEAASTEQIAALRAELRTLREHLETLLGGEVLVERVALHAESTRMLGLGDSTRNQEDQLNQQLGSAGRAAPARRPANLAASEQTMRHDPVSGPDPVVNGSAASAASGNGQSAGTPAANTPPPNQRPAERRAPRTEQPASAMWPSLPRTSQPGQANQPGQPSQPGQQPPAAQQRPAEQPVAKPAEPQRQPEPQRQAEPQRQPEPQRQEPRQAPRQYGVNGNGHVPTIDPSWTPSWEAAESANRAGHRQDREARQPAATDWANSWQPDLSGIAGGNGSNGHGSNGQGGNGSNGHPGGIQNGAASNGAASNGAAPNGAGPNAAAQHGAAPSSAAPGSAVPSGPAPGGDQDSAENPQPAETGGRRRRPDGVSFTESFGGLPRPEQSSGRHGVPAAQGGGHAKPEPEPVPEPEPEPEQEPGAHGAGVAVSDLLAAHGRKDPGSTGRRRRRED
ncbi:DUF6779 domain-containing protein [Sciscionella sediminilitoris]|uniref:DUF6779 domain-containing protein n=1 Tax=Sciscionella sediminilitoris TaxID=1445613 RepID=UPI0005693DE7|nr:DUF6779 domain-containing protein [Sciscionella sp. SE31]